MTTESRVPADNGDDESPRGSTSKLLRRAGLTVGLAWAVGCVMWLIWELANDPEGLIGLLLVTGFLLSAGLILASVLIDRLKDRKTDRYRSVKR